MAEFRPAAEVAAGFHAEVIAPLLGDIGYAAGLLGWGSDVLGYDTARSMDHGWGPRLVVLVDADQVERVRKAGEPALSAADKQALVNIVAARTGKSQQEAQQVVDNYARAYQQAAEQDQRQHAACNGHRPAVPCRTRR